MASKNFRTLRLWGGVVVAAIAIAIFVQLVIARPYAIPSESMAPTLTDGDRVMVNRLSYSFGSVERGQVIVFDTPPNHESTADVVIKRVIGLPGETVQLRDGQVYVDSKLVIEPYMAPDTQTRQGSRRIPGCAQQDPSLNRCEVPEGHVFVLGDNRTFSEDSRLFGPVPIDSIVGRAAMRIWPPNSFNQL